MNLTNAHLRVARPTDKLVEVVKFYKDGLGFEVLYQFTDHDGFDGVMLGHKDAPYHLEFTHKTNHSSGSVLSPRSRGLAACCKAPGRSRL